MLLRRPELLVTDRRAVQVIGIGAFDFNSRDLANAQRSAAFHKNRTVDLRRVAFAAALGAAGATTVHADSSMMICSPEMLRSRVLLMPMCSTVP